jgi:hypothetical protein
MGAQRKSDYFFRGIYFPENHFIFPTALVSWRREMTEICLKMPEIWEAGIGGLYIYFLALSYHFKGNLFFKIIFFSYCR